MAAGKVLLVATNHTKFSDGTPTGSWVEEVAAPYFRWREAGFEVTVASLKGGEIPFDPASKSGDFLTPSADAFLKDSAAAKSVAESVALETVLGGELERYDAIFLPGGHGVMYDGPGDAHLKLALETLWAAGKVVSAVCHGPAGLVDACGPSGEPIVKGRRVTGFTNSEEVGVGKEKLVPFSLEDRLRELGGEFERGPDWGVHAVRDGQLVTGQNPASSARVAELVVEALSGLKGGPVHGKGEGEGFHKRGHPVAREHHHEHREGLEQGKRHDAPNPQFQRSSWHQPARQ